VLHAHVFVTTVKTLRSPQVDLRERVRITRIDDTFSQVELRYGFMETPDVREDLIAAGLPGAKSASFFIGRNNYAVANGMGGMPLWQDVLFVALHRNSADPTDYFAIPSNRVIELGAQYAI
jgi:KUP system potassium uptake protein